MCSPSLSMDFQWKVHDDQCGSDHFPIFTSINKPLPEERVPRWQLHKANWSEYHDLCLTAINTESFLNINDPISKFTDSLMDICSKTIPKSSTNPNNNQRLVIYKNIMRLVPRLVKRSNKVKEILGKIISPNLIQEPQ